MPRIADTWVNVAAYIYSSLDAARAGDRFGASGFIVGVPLEEMPEMAIAYVVTNKHVIKSPSGKKRTPVIRLNRKDGESNACPQRQINGPAIRMGMTWLYSRSILT